MRKLTLLAISLVGLASLNAQTNTFKVDGKLSGADYNGQTIYLQKLNAESGRGFDNVDSVLVKNNSFQFQGKLTKNGAFRMISFADNGALMPAMVILEPGLINVAMDTLTVVSGTAKNAEYHDFAMMQEAEKVKLNAIREEFQRLQSEDKITPEKSAELQASYMAIVKEMFQKTFTYAKSNMNNELGEFLLLSSVRSLETSQIEELIALATPEFKQTESVKSLQAHIQSLKATAIGSTYSDIALTTPDGKTISLSDYVGKNKVVLIDFWASWCGPCRKEMPVVVDAYAKYKEKGFEVIGVSLDDKKEAWIKGIKDLNMTWPQMSDLKGWKSDAAKLYAVRSIPATFLLDQDGKIIAKDLRGEDLLNKLEELLK